MSNLEFLSAVQIFPGQKSSQILIIGNCDGKLYFFEVIDEQGKQSSAIKVDELKLNASFLSSKKIHDNNTQEQDGKLHTYAVKFLYCLSTLFYPIIHNSSCS